MPTTTGNATQFITFSRGSLATVTDADGRIKWAPHNLLLASEQFDASVWTKSTTAAATVTANTATAPNSTTTADRVVGAAGLWFVKQNISQAIGQKFTFGLWVKSNIGSSQTFRIYGDETATISSNQTATTAWQLFTIEFTASQAGSYAVGIIADSSQTAADLLVWGGYCYRSDLGGMQANASAYPMYNPSTPRNLLGYSEDFSVWSGSAWQTNGLRAFGSGSIANAITAPNGSLSADLITTDTANSLHRTFFNPTVTASCVTLSCYVRANGYNKVAVLTGDATASGAVFEITGAGTVVNTYQSGVATVSNPLISSVGDSWYRVSCVVTFSTPTATRFSFHIMDPSYTSGSLTNTWTANGTAGVYVWGAQLSDSASLDAYSPVYGAAVTSAAYYAPRLDYSGSSLAALGLLVEEQRANIVLRSQEFDNATNWTPLNGSITANASTAPDGASSADKLVEDTATGSHAVYQSINFTANTAYTVSLFAKAWERTRINIFTNAQSPTTNLFDVTFNLSTGVATATHGTATITDVGNGWYRCTVSNTMGGTGTTANLQIRLDNGTTTSYTGVTGNGVLIWGAQLEAGSFATSYIPTAASTVTRNADVASVATSQFPYSASEGTLVGEVMGLLSSTITQVPLVNFGDTNNRIELRAVGDPFTYNRAVVVTSGSTVVDIGAIGLPSSASATRKVGLAFKLNDFATVGNGGTVVTTASGTIPSVSVMNIGTAPYSASLKTNGWIARITYIPRRLTNAELQARTV